MPAELIEVAPGCVLNVAVDGPAEGTPLLLLPALGTDTTLWAPQCALTAQGYRVVRVDAPGHGQSPDWPAVTLAGLADAVWAIADQLGVDRVILAGTSMGAVIALRAASRQPARVNCLVLCGALLQRHGASARELAQRLTTLQGDLRQVATTMVARWFPEPGAAAAATSAPGAQSGTASGTVSGTPPALSAARPPGSAAQPDASRRQALRAAVTAMVTSTSPAGYAACAQALADYDLLPELQQMQDRAVLLTGAHDPGVPEHFAQLQALCPQARLIVVPDAGHFPALEDPAAFAAAL